MAEIQVNHSTGVLPVKNMNALQRVKGIITSPGMTMESLVEKPKLLLPFIIVAVAQLILYFARYPLYQDYMNRTLTEPLMAAGMTADSIDKFILAMTAATPLTTLFGWFITAVIFFAVFKIFGAKGKFKQYMSITGHAYIITALYYVIVLVASFFTGSLHLNLTLTSIANLLPAEMAGTFIYGIAMAIDIFSLWYYCVIAIGMAAVSGFRKRNAYILVGLIYAVGVLIAGFGAAATKALTGG